MDKDYGLIKLYIYVRDINAFKSVILIKPTAAKPKGRVTI